MEQAEALEPLARLEGRIRETVEQLRVARREKTAAEQEAARLRGRVAALEQERREIIQRVEKLLQQIDLLAAG